MAKEACLYGKRGLVIWQKRPIDMEKDACLYGKRDLLIWQKRPIDMAKEAYAYGIQYRKQATRTGPEKAPR